MIGKKVLNNVYWHYSMNAFQTDEVQQHIVKVEQLFSLQADINYNVAKFNINKQELSLLWYPDFFKVPFPVLETSYRINLNKQRLEKRNYNTSLNPPILHRKELLLREDDVRVPQFKELTSIAEQLGLFDNPVQIGFKQNWERLIAEKGFQLIGNEFIAISNSESIDDPNLQLSQSNKIARHLTALSRNNLSAPIQCLARHGVLDGSLSIFDYGCGKGDDIRNLRVNNINVSGWDPHYAPDLPKQSADIVNIGFVINVIENYQERIA